MLNDQVARLDTKTGEFVEYLLPRTTNIRRVFVDDKGTAAGVLGRQQSWRFDREARTARLAADGEHHGALDLRRLASRARHVALPAAAGAQGVISERNVSIELGAHDRGRRHGMRQRWRGLSVAVVDRSGQLQGAAAAATARRRTAPSWPAARPTRPGRSGGRRWNGPSAARPISWASAIWRRSSRSAAACRSRSATR